MTATHPKSLSYPKFKIAIFALLVCNAVIYAFVDAPSAAVDAIAWLLLLALFEWETEFSERLSTTTTVHIARIAAIFAVGAATIAYGHEQAWLDFANSGLWIAVVVMLEYEVRFPHIVARHPGALMGIAAGLYGGLTVLVLIWASRGEWLDAYDAVLWIIAFVTIEMDMLRFSQRVSGEG